MFGSRFESSSGTEERNKQVRRETQVSDRGILSEISIDFGRQLQGFRIRDDLLTISSFAEVTSGI